MTRSPYIIGYSFNAALVCPVCTAAAIFEGELIHRTTDPITNKPLTKAVTHFESHGYQPFTIPEALFNTNHEPVLPIFDTDDYPDGYTCDTCGELHP